MDDEDQNYDIVVPFYKNYQDARIIDTTVYAAIFDYNTTIAAFSFVNQLAVDVDGDGDLDPLGTQTYSELQVGWYNDYTSDLFPSMWQCCDPRAHSCCKTWQSIFHGCNDYGQPSQWDGQWLDTGNPLCDNAGVRGFWARAAWGGRPGECTTQSITDEFGLTLTDLVNLLDKGTPTTYMNQDAIAFTLNAETTQITLTQGDLSWPLTLGNAEETVYLLTDSMKFLTVVNADNKDLLPVFESYAAFIEAASPGGFDTTITYKGVTATYSGLGIDTNKEVMRGVRAQLEALNR
jgi:hypothetical protein